MQQRFSPLLKSLSPTPTTDTVKPGHTNCLLLGRGDLSYRVTVKSRANLQSEAYVRVTLYNVWEVEVGQKGGCLCKRRRRTGRRRSQDDGALEVGDGKYLTIWKLLWRISFK